jgi:SAM-dependent methyltransferase
VALERRYYAGVVGEQELFDELVRSHLRPGSSALDAGAGRGVVFPHDYRATAARVAGVDVSPAVLANPSLTEATVSDLAALPYGDAEFDLAFSRYVFEHLERPADVLRELRRVLRPGGHLVILTPNRWHYVPLAARVTPVRFHAWFNARLGRAEADTFATFYRANDPAAIRRLAEATGFRVVSISLLETQPFYLSFHPVAYRVGVGYERAVNRWDVLARFRVHMLVDLQAL